MGEKGRSVYESITRNTFRKFCLAMNAVKRLMALRNEPQVKLLLGGAEVTAAAIKSYRSTQWTYYIGGWNKNSVKMSKFHL